MAQSGKDELWLFIAWVFGNHDIFKKYQLRVSLEFIPAGCQQLPSIRGDLHEEHPHLMGKQPQQKLAILN